MKCKDVKLKSTLLKLRIGDHYTTIVERLHQLSLILEDDMFDDDTLNRCQFPMFAMPPPNEGTANESGDRWLPQLEEEKNTWFLGSIFFEKYFMVFDNTPYHHA